LWQGQAGAKAEIIHDRFTIEPPGWDWNFDDEAFEAVDETSHPVLQLLYRTPSEIIVRGIFVAAGSALAVTDQGFSGLPLSAVETVHIPRLFKYPHEKYLHVRE
jgi:hypothetical protein